jgi:DNA adenine methylase
VSHLGQAYPTARQRRAVSISQAEQGLSLERPVNVAQIPQLSPFRYPGGKTWLVPQVRQWLSALPGQGTILVEPFAGGAMVGLTAAAENLCDGVVLGELDQDVASVWKVIFHAPEADVSWLCDKIRHFEVSLKNVTEALSKERLSLREHAFCTIIKNRMHRGGILAPGSGLMKAGENGNGLKSRWYPETLAKRIEALVHMRDRITFVHQDAFRLIKAFADMPNAIFFVDPPYTAGGKRVGARLYRHSEIDHEGLFGLLASAKGAVMLTYDDLPEVREMATRHGFSIETVPMKSTHHKILNELILLKAPSQQYPEIRPDVQIAGMEAMDEAELVLRLTR